MRRIFGDWELKLVALVLAIALWIYTSGQARVDRTVAVEVPAAAVVGLPEGMQVAGLTPESFVVQLSVPTSRLPELRTDTIVPRLDLRGEPRGAGPVSFALTSRLLGLPNDIRVVGTEPAGIRAVTVSLDQLVEDHLPVEAPEVRLRDGLDAAVRLDRTRVRVRAPAVVMEDLRREGGTVRFHAIDLGDLDPANAAGREERLVLTPAVGRYEVVEPVMAMVQVRASAAVRQVIALPVQVLLPRQAVGRFQVELSQEQVAVTVRGPAALLRSLRPEDLTAHVRMPVDAEPGLPFDAAVEVSGPAWLAHEPVRVRVTLRAAPSR